MASEKILDKKRSQVADLTGTLQDSVTGIIVDYKGITVAADTKMRAELRAAGVEYKVIKNNILKRACTEAGFGELEEVLVGTNAIAISKEDVVAPAKILAKYAKELGDKLNVKGGFVEGQVVGVEQIKEIAQLPSREELVAQTLRGLNAPISGLVTVLNGNIRGLAQVLGQIAEQQTA